MRWTTFFILLYLMTALQGADLGGFPSGPRIEYLGLLALFYALYAAETAAPMAAIVCGGAYDVVNGDYLGTNLVPLALVAVAIVHIRLSIFREHYISQLIMTLLGVLAFAVVSVLFRRMIGAPLEGAPLGDTAVHGSAPAAWVHLGRLAGNAVYTAAVAPGVFWVMLRFHHLLGFSSHGPRMRGRA